MVCAAYASFNDYFVVKNKFMLGISQTIVAAVAMVIPLFSRWLMDLYGYRGTVAIFSALSLHTLAAMLTLQPVERHMKKIRVSKYEISGICLTLLCYKRNILSQSYLKFLN